MIPSSPTHKMLFFLQISPGYTTVLVFYCCVTIKLSKTTRIYYQIHRSKSPGRLKWVLCLGSLKAKIKVLGRLYSF